MPLAISVTAAVLSGVAVLAMIAVPYLVLYRVFRHDSHKAPDE